MMGNRHEQRELFLRYDDSPASLFRRHWSARRTIMPGDWLLIEHKGKTVVGMIYRCRDETYTFVYWDDLILRFGVASRDHIGDWDDELTDLFRGQIAVVPDYLDTCIAAWVMQPAPRASNKPDMKTWEPRHEGAIKVQKRLFPEAGQP
jgi:hypothetical protein